MAIPILVEALFFFLAFSALPVSVIYWIKSREHWIIPYILIQVVTLVYVCVDILFTGAGRTLARSFRSRSFWRCRPPCVSSFSSWFLFS
jgi:hypothetical protein